MAPIRRNTVNRSDRTLLGARGIAANAAIGRYERSTAGIWGSDALVHIVPNSKHCY